MNYKGYILILITLFINSIPIVSKGEVMFLSCLSTPNSENTSSEKYNIPPIANNDTIVHLTGCGRNFLSGNVIANDFAPDGDSIRLYFINSPKINSFSYDEEGTFILTLLEGFTGLIQFEYYITELNERAFKARGEVLIFVHADNDCDGVKDEEDLDNDNDGLLNSDEGAGTIDTDNDGITDDYDIDSDNDGITDIVEWQKEDSYMLPANVDLNRNGWDDAYDTEIGGSYFSLVDTDEDGIADYIDDDSDEDGLSDFFESKSAQINESDKPFLLGIDTDKDGLDDIYDNVDCYSDIRNVCGSNAELKDSDSNGVRDWRDFQKAEEGVISLFPNPVHDYITINRHGVSQDQIVELSVYDIAGRLLISKILHSSQRMDLSSLENAIYIVKINVEDQTTSQQIVVSH